MNNNDNDGFTIAGSTGRKGKRNQRKAAHKVVQVTRKVSKSSDAEMIRLTNALKTMDETFAMVDDGTPCSKWEVEGTFTPEEQAFISKEYLDHGYTVSWVLGGATITYNDAKSIETPESAIDRFWYKLDTQLYYKGPWSFTFRTNAINRDHIVGDLKKCDYKVEFTGQAVVVEDMESDYERTGDSLDATWSASRYSVAWRFEPRPAKFKPQIEEQLGSYNMDVTFEPDGAISTLTRKIGMTGSVAQLTPFANGDVVKMVDSESIPSMKARSSSLKSVLDNRASNPRSPLVSLADMGSMLLLIGKFLTLDRHREYGLDLLESVNEYRMAKIRAFTKTTKRVGHRHKK